VTDRSRPRGETDVRRPAGARLRLEHVGVHRARAIAGGDLSGVDPAPGWPHADTLDALRMDAGYATTDEETTFLVLLADGGQVIGEGGWKGGPDRFGAVEIGYGLAGPFRGRGLGTELVGLLAGWAGSRRGVRVVTAQVLIGNEPSWRALERNGFEQFPRPDDPRHRWYRRLVSEVPVEVTDG
jgi:RimJ/RimL family protein N-acetyltransferase